MTLFGLKSVAAFILDGQISPKTEVDVHKIQLMLWFSDKSQFWNKPLSWQDENIIIWHFLIERDNRWFERKYMTFFLLFKFQELERFSSVLKCFVYKVDHFLSARCLQSRPTALRGWRKELHSFVRLSSFVRGRSSNGVELGPRTKLEPGPRTRLDRSEADQACCLLAKFHTIIPKIRHNRASSGFVRLRGGLSLPKIRS